MSNKCSVKGCAKTAVDSLMLPLVKGSVGWVPLCGEHIEAERVWPEVEMPERTLDPAKTSPKRPVEGADK